MANSLGIARPALVRAQGTLHDLSKTWPENLDIEILSRDHPDVLPVLRHDAAHVMAQAVKALYPDAQVTIGPDIADGFYYDFYFPAVGIRPINPSFRALPRVVPW